MKNFFENKRLLSIFGTVLLVLVIIFSSVGLRNNRKAPLIIQSLGNDIVAIGANVVNVPVNLITGGATSVNNLLKVQEENDKLKARIDELDQTEARNSVLEEENRQLKKALKLDSTLSDYTKIDASVISRSPDTWSDIITINKGSASGIKKNMAVMSGGGVIGRILEVNAVTSKVELITTTDQSANRFAVQATTKNGKSVHGILSVTSSNQVSFTQVVDSSKLAKGTKVYTSGLGGITPKGLLIGTISQTTKDSFGLSNVILINLAGNINDPSVVTVISRKV
ncbi:MAG: rod shape-determining protein MreC [Lactobacillus sp.]|nr:rod shape-determining protein MreC [Lactobacillus sp.]